MFDINLIKDGVAVTVIFTGELDYSEMESCLPVMEAVKNTQRSSYIADLTALTAIDSSGLGVLISIRNAAVRAGGELTIRGASGAVAETLAMTRFDVLAKMEPG